MLRYLPVGVELLGLAIIVFGSYLFHPALGVVAGGAAVVAVGYALEDAT